MPKPTFRSFITRALQWSERAEKRQVLGNHTLLEDSIGWKGFRAWGKPPTCIGYFDNLQQLKGQDAWV